MGYRASVVTRHRAYGSAPFCDFSQFQEYFDKLYILYPDNSLHQSDGLDYFEIEKVVAEREIERLQNLGPEKDFEFQPHWAGDDKEDNETVMRSWRTSIDESPKDSDYIALEWY